MYDSLLFAADGDRVDYVNSGAFTGITVGTLLLWFYPTNDTDRQTVCSSLTEEWQINLRGDLISDPFDCLRQRSTTYVNARANSANFAAYGLNKWLFIAFRFDATVGTATEQRIYLGDLNRPAAEPSSYSIQTAGSGSANVSAGDYRVGNSSVDTSLRKFKGRIAFAAVYNRALTLKEIIEFQQDLQFQIANPAAAVKKFQRGCVLFAPVGRDGHSCKQRDWSGKNNHGTVTGATGKAGVPLGRPRPYRNRVRDFAASVGAAAFDPSSGFPWPDQEEPHFAKRGKMLAY